MDTIVPKPPDAPSGEVLVHASTDAAVRSEIRLAVTVPTFKRPRQVLDTLRSVAVQDAPVPFAVVVVENDAEVREGAAAAAAFFAARSVPSVTIVAKRRGNCAAYNAGWRTALERYPNLDWILVIDDDEVARPLWISNMLSTAQETGADFVGAPQVPVFDDPVAARAGEHPVFRTPYGETGPVPVLYSSGNVLIRADLLRASGPEWLDEWFNFLGGGDSDFYARSRAKGATFAWCTQGALDETTPSRRGEFSWLNARALRNGSISAAIERRAAKGAGDHVKRVAKTFALLIASGPRALLLAVKLRSARAGLVHPYVALGRLLMECGFANEQYRAADRN